MHRISTSTALADLFGVGKPGFRDGNKAAGVAATELNAAFCNAVQEELCSAIEVFQPLNAGSRTQLRDLLAAKAPLSSVGNHSGVVYITGGNYAVTKAQAGSFFVVTANSAITLPTDAPVGARFDFFSSSGSSTIATVGGNFVLGFGVVPAAIPLIGDGCNASFVSQGTNSFVLAGGSANFKYTKEFSVLSAEAGYQRLPSGLVWQWGVLADGAWVANVARWISFPIAFTADPLQILPGTWNSNYFSGAYVSTDVVRTKTGFGACMAGGGAQTFRYIAIGKID